VKLVVKIYDSFLKGDLKSSLEAQKQLIPRRRAFSLANYPQVVKESLKVGNLDVGDARSPVPATNSDAGKEIAKIVKSVLAIY
jgi:dihydrodipicolinate synthase/N-acetylneuraminate lyase